MKKLITYLLIFISYLSFAQKDVTISQALNIAGKQSMLSQRLVTEKIFQVTDGKNQNTSSKIKISLIQFEENMSILKNMDASKHITSQITTLEMLWMGYKANILDNDPKTYAKTIEFSSVILWHCNDIFEIILMLSEVKKMYPYNSTIPDLPKAYIATNSLKYLFQQVSLYYNAYSSKILEYDAKKLKTLIATIDESILNLAKVEDIDTTIKEKTTLIKTQWITLKEHIDKATLSDFIAFDNYPKSASIFKEANVLLKNADLLGRLYKSNSYK